MTWRITIEADADWNVRTGADAGQSALRIFDRFVRMVAATEGHDGEACEVIVLDQLGGYVAVYRRPETPAG